MAFVGMNVENVRNTGNELKRISSEIQGLMNQLNRTVNSTEWIGSDSDRFKNDWWPQHQGQLSKIVQDLEGLGQSALNNAEEQEEVSS